MRIPGEEMKGRVGYERGIGQSTPGRSRRVRRLKCRFKGEEAPWEGCPEGNRAAKVK